MESGKNFAFRLSGLYVKYLERIIQDLKTTSPTQIMKQVISEYILMKYGEEVQKNLRREYIETVI